MRVPHQPCGATRERAEGKAEVEQRAKMNQAAEGQVDAKVAFLNLLPDVINDLVEEAGEGRNDMQ